MRDSRSRFERRRWVQRRAAPLLRRSIVAKALGFRWNGGTLIDRALPVPLEYDPGSEIGASLFATGAFEEADIRFVERLIRPSSTPTILDVGANIGLHSIRWIDAFPDGECFAFEPSRATAEILRRNVALNGLDERVEVIEQALADTAGERTFFSASDDAYSSLRDTRRKTITETYPVDVTTVDAFVEARSLTKVDLIKIDVEGLEGQVLQGAEHTLEALRPNLFVEIYGGEASNPDPEGTISFVTGRGYRAFVLEDGVATPFTSHSDRRYNYYFEPA